MSIRGDIIAYSYLSYMEEQAPHTGDGERLASICRIGHEALKRIAFETMGNKSYGIREVVENGVCRLRFGSEGLKCLLGASANGESLFVGRMHTWDGEVEEEIIQIVEPVILTGATQNLSITIKPITEGAELVVFGFRQVMGNEFSALSIIPGFVEDDGQMLCSENGYKLKIYENGRRFNIAAQMVIGGSVEGAPAAYPIGHPNVAMYGEIILLVAPFKRSVTIDYSGLERGKLDYRRILSRSTRESPIAYDSETLYAARTNRGTSAGEARYVAGGIDASKIQAIRFRILFDATGIDLVSPEYVAIMGAARKEGTESIHAIVCNYCGRAVKPGKLVEVGGKVYADSCGSCGGSSFSNIELAAVEK